MGARPALSSRGLLSQTAALVSWKWVSSPQFLPGGVSLTWRCVPPPHRCAPPPKAGPGGCRLQFGCIVFLRDTNHYFFPPCQEHVPSPPAPLGALCVAASVNFLAMGSLWWLGSPVWCVGLGCLGSREQPSQGTQPGFADSQVLPAGEPCLAKCRHGSCSEDPAWTLGLGCGPGSPVGGALWRESISSAPLIKTPLCSAS